MLHAPGRPELAPAERLPGVAKGILQGAGLDYVLALPRIPEPPGGVGHEVRPEEGFGTDVYGAFVIPVVGGSKVP